MKFFKLKFYFLQFQISKVQQCKANEESLAVEIIFVGVNFLQVSALFNESGKVEAVTAGGKLVRQIFRVDFEASQSVLSDLKN